jgi:holin-like protein
MVLLFIALAAGWVREEQVGAVSEFFLGNIGFFFVPVVVSLMTVVGLAPLQMAQLTGVSIISTIITLALTGLAVQAIIGRREVK